MTKRADFLAGEPVASLRYEATVRDPSLMILLLAMREMACESLPIVEGLRAFVGENRHRVISPNPSTRQ